MLTRYKVRSELYSSVFEEPNMMNTILRYLTPRDVANLRLSNGDFTKEERFKSLIEEFMNNEREKQCRNLVLKSEFYDKMRTYTRDGALMSCYRCKKIFDCVLQYKEVLGMEGSTELKRVFHDKLIELIDIIEVDPLYYLGEIFGIYPKARASTNPLYPDHYEEYIEDLNGNIIVL